MKEIIKLTVKIVLCRLMHFAISMTFMIINEIITRPRSDQKVVIMEAIIIVMFQLPMYLIYRIRPLKTKRYKIIYWAVSISLTAYTAWFWMHFKFETM